MAEYLSMDWPTLRSRIGEYLNYGRSSSGWTDGTGGTQNHVAEIQDCIDDGYRVLCNPELADGAQHEWSWMIARTTLVTAGDGWEIDLPADFGNMRWPIFYAPGVSRTKINSTSEAAILMARSASSTSGRPLWAVVVPKQGVGATAQRWKLQIHPPADAVYTLHIAYSIQPAPMSVSAPYPICGGQFGQILLESCLAAAERDKLKIIDGPHQVAYNRLLRAAIQLDKRQDAESLGFMRGGSGVYSDPAAVRRTDGVFGAYNGTVYD